MMVPSDPASWYSHSCTVFAHVSGLVCVTNETGQRRQHVPSGIRLNKALYFPVLLSPLDLGEASCHVVSSPVEGLTWWEPEASWTPMWVSMPLGNRVFSSQALRWLQPWLTIWLQLQWDTLSQKYYAESCSSSWNKCCCFKLLCFGVFNRQQYRTTVIIKGENQIIGGYQEW